MSPALPKYNQAVDESSEPRSTHRTEARFPRAFLLAIGIVIAFEIFLHTRSPRAMIAYPPTGAATDQTITYTAVRQFMEQEPAEVALIGSSQMREGVVMPKLTEAVRARVGREVRIANYATRGSRVDAMQAAVQHLLDQEHRPKLLVIGLATRDLRTQVLDTERMALFWDFDEWLKYEQARLGWDATRYLPTVVRNEAGKACYTLRYREQLAIEATRPFAKAFGIKLARESNPIIGEMSSQHLYGKGERSLADPKVNPKRLFDGAWKQHAYEEGPRPSDPMAERLQTMLRQIQASGVRAIVVEMPVASYLETELTKHGLLQAFDRSVTSLTQRAGVRYIPCAQQSFQPGLEHFSDTQHLNRPGGEGFGDWLAGEIAAELR